MTKDHTGEEYLGKDRDELRAIIVERDIEIEQLRGNLSLAEDGLAAATQEIELVRAQRDLNLAKEVETVSRLEAEIGVLQSRLEGSQAAAAVGEREIEQLKRNLAWQSKEIDAQVGEIARLREVLTIPLITPDTTSSALFIRVLSEHEKGLPVNTQDLINALMWRVKNQRKEIARLHEKRATVEPVPAREFDIESHQGTYTEKSRE